MIRRFNLRFLFTKLVVWFLQTLLSPRSKFPAPIGYRLLPGSERFPVIVRLIQEWRNLCGMTTAAVAENVGLINVRRDVRTKTQQNANIKFPRTMPEDYMYIFIEQRCKCNLIWITMDSWHLVLYQIQLQLYNLVLRVNKLRCYYTLTLRELILLL